jgi:hypothetical protein
MPVRIANSFPTISLGSLDFGSDLNFIFGSQASDLRFGISGFGSSKMIGICSFLYLFRSFLTILNRIIARAKNAANSMARMIMILFMASNLFAKQHPNKMKNTQSWQGKKQQNIEGKYAKALDKEVR